MSKNLLKLIGASFVLSIATALIVAPKLQSQTVVNVSTIPTAGWSIASNNDAILTLDEPVPSATSAAQVVTGVGNCTNGVHLFRTTEITAAGQSTGSAASASTTCDGTHKQVTVTIPTGSPFVTGRNVYATKAGGSIYYLVATAPVVNNNTSPTYTFNIADGSFTSTTLPTSSTARDVRFRVNPTTGAVTPGAFGTINAAQLVIASQAAYDTLYASSATAWTRLAHGSTGQLYRQTATAPSWSTATFPDTVASAGQWLRASAANIWAVSTSTIADTFSAGDVLVASGANAVAGTACATGTVLAGGSPAACTATPSVTSVTVKAGTGSQTGKTCATIFSSVATTGSSTGGTVNVSSYTLPTNTLSADGQSLEIRGCSLHAANTNSVTYRYSIFGTLLNTATSADSGGLACAVLTVTRQSSSVADVLGYTAASGGFTQNRNHITSVDYTSGSVNTIFEQFGTSTANNDLTGLESRVTWCSE